MKILAMVIILAVMFCHISLAQVPEMVNGWPYGTKTASQPTWATPYYFINSDLDNSSIFFNTNLGDVDKFHFDASLYSNWPLNFDSLKFMLSPVLVDLDHDGEVEMLTIARSDPGWHNCYLFAFDDDGSVIPGFPITLHSPDILNVADLDGDNEYEIIADSWDDRLIYCFDRYGALKPGWPIQLPDDCWPHYAFAASVGDLDRDGTNEFIIDGDKHIYAYRFDGLLQSGFPIAVMDTSFNYSANFWPGCLVDLDDDGYLEYAVSGNNWYVGIPSPECFVALYDHAGLIKEGWPLYYQGVVRGGITPADMNNDGVPELGFSSGWHISNGTRFVDGSGEVLPGWPVFLAWPGGGEGGTRTDFILTDINGDGLPEIFVDNNTVYPDSMGHDSLWYYGYSYLLGYDQNGQFLSGLPMRVNGEFFFRPPNFAWDPQGHKAYMGLFTNIDARPMQNLDTAFLDIYRWPDSTGPLTEWPMLNHDNLHTRNYNFVDNVTAIHEGQDILPKSFILKQNYPNPFNRSTLIEFVLPKTAHVTLALYDILGREIADLMDEIRPPGPCKYNLNMDVPSGVYFYTLTAENTRITRKMMVIK